MNQILYNFIFLIEIKFPVIYNSLNLIFNYAGFHDFYDTV